MNMRKVLLSLLVVGSALLASCNPFGPLKPTPLPPGWMEVPFTSIERNDGLAYDLNTPRKPVLYLVNEPEDLQQVTSIIFKDTYVALEQLNYDENAVLVVAVTKGGAGFYIEIRRIEYHDGMLTVHAELGEPNDLVAAVESGYYHAVRIARSDLPGPFTGAQLELETKAVRPTQLGRRIP